MALVREAADGWTSALKPIDKGDWGEGNWFSSGGSCYDECMAAGGKDAECLSQCK